MKRLLYLLIFAISPAFAAPQDLVDINSTTAAVISCTTTSSSVAFSNPGSPNIRVYNAGTAAVFLLTGDSTVSATFPTNAAVTGLVVAPGAIESFSKLPNHTHIACDASTGTQTVYVSSGKGE